jgi:putative flippase GtrA
MQYSRYGLVGVAGYILNLLVFSFAVYVLNIYYMISAVLAFIITVTFSFTLHNLFSFKSPISGETTKRYFTFIGTSLFAGVMALALLYALVEGLQLYKVVAQAIASLVGGTTNFFISRKFVFLRGR